MHLAIDGYGGDTAKMWDAQLVRDFLFRCPDELGMTRITEPEVLEYNAPKPEDAGISGFVIIAESHISIHTFPRREYVNIDIFSCRPFDDQRALAEEKGPEAQRRVELLRLRFHEGRPIREIARLWETDPAELHRSYAKAREEFRESLAEIVSFHHPGSSVRIERECTQLLELLG